MYLSIDRIKKMTNNIKELWKPDSDINAPSKTLRHTHIMKIKHDWPLTFNNFS